MRLIYGTRAMAPYKDGKVCINRKGEKTWYIFYMADEGEAMPAQVTMKGLVIPAGAKVTVPGSGARCTWKNGTDSFTINIPASIRNNPPSRSCVGNESRVLTTVPLVVKTCHTDLCMMHLGILICVA
ncbi:MAG: hypothetical protein MZV63_37675 [Marinilabiliales bacterium]|nr:hypothetical protein [Marinilabiliales bacterium]